MCTRLSALGEAWPASLRLVWQPDDLLNFSCPWLPLSNYAGVPRSLLDLSFAPNRLTGIRMEIFVFLTLNSDPGHWRDRPRIYQPGRDLPPCLCKLQLSGSRKSDRVAVQSYTSCQHYGDQANHQATSPFRTLLMSYAESAGSIPGSRSFSFRSYPFFPLRPELFTMT